MVDTISIVVAIIALLGTLANSAFTAYERIHIERSKRQDALNDALVRYRDPLHLSAVQLSSKLRNLIDHGLAAYILGGNQRQAEYVVTHTCFVFGQFFAWVYILRREVQFLRLSTDPSATETKRDAKTAELERLLNWIRTTLRSDADVGPFMIWTGEQQALGEIMCEKVEDMFPISTSPILESNPTHAHRNRLTCIGYATFMRRWKTDQEFKDWFSTIADDIVSLASGEGSSSHGRMGRLQHLLVDLASLLDPKEIHGHDDIRCEMRGTEGYGCPCTACSGQSS